MLSAPKDATSIVGLLECNDGTTAVIGMRHQAVEAEIPKFRNSNLHGSVRLTKEAGEALYELLGDWLGKRREGHSELDYDGPESVEDEGYSFDPAELQRQAGHE